MLNPPKEWNLERERPVLNKLKGPEKRLNAIAMRTIGSAVRYPNKPSSLSPMPSPEVGKFVVRELEAGGDSDGMYE